jgi:hypothetical protein
MKHAPRLELLAAIAIIGLAAVAIGYKTITSGSVTNGSVIDGWTLGDIYHCTDPDPERPCSALLPFAQKRLDQRDPGHSPVVASELRFEANPNVVRTGSLYVAVFTLADGQHKAIAVTYPEVATYIYTKDYGP